jgi:hypothetical protein
MFCWNILCHLWNTEHPCRGQINELDQVQKKDAQFTNHMKDCDWETFTQRRTISHLWALFKVYSGEWVWKDIHDRLWKPYNLSRVDHVQKIRDRKQRTDIGKYAFVSGTIKNWNQLPAEAWGTLPCKPRVTKAIINGVKWKE